MKIKNRKEFYQRKTLKKTRLPTQLVVFFLSFLSEISCFVSMFLLLEWRVADHVFITSFQWEQLALWKERKEPHHPLKLERN